MQNTRHIAMVRPAAFGFNEETAANNFFQDNNQPDNTTLQQKALEQFDAMVLLLRNNGIDVLVLDDELSPRKPDAIFPNNWFSCNKNVISIFPMYAPNRRIEKRPELVEAIKNKTGITRVSDWSHYENDHLFLEGTGSMIIDHDHNIAYACLSERTDESLFSRFCKDNNYLPVAFAANDSAGRDIYHTNVMMCIGKKLAVICLNAITNDIDRVKVVHELKTTGHEIIDISFEQMNHFAGNMLELVNDKNEPLLVMSKTAFDVLLPSQIETLGNYAAILCPDVSVIEKAGGGSVRCMMAELFY